MSKIKTFLSIAALTVTMAVVGVSAAQAKVELGATVPVCDCANEDPPHYGVTRDCICYPEFCIIQIDDMQ